MVKKDQFLSLLLKNNKKLFGFIVACVPSYDDAEDIMQEVASILWTKFETFEEGTNFYGWAKQIARYKISYYYRQQKHTLKFDEEALANIIDANESLDKSLDVRMSALQGCLKKLHLRDANLIKIRYQQNVPVRKIAKDTNMSVSLLYKRLAAIYVMLRKCISKTLTAWEVSS